MKFVYLFYSILFVLQVCDSAVTYYASNDTCTGVQKLQDRCALSGKRAAKIANKESLKRVLKAINAKEKYWIGLR